MWKLFARKPSRRRVPAARPLRFERLESRLCLAAASIQNLVAQVEADQMVRLSGQVVDENPASVVVSFDGVVSGSTTANADGYFELLGQASGLGWVTAIATDDESLNSDAAAVQVSADDPAISLSASTIASDGSVQISGDVAGSFGSQAVVVLSGAGSGEFSLSSGTFSGTLSASGAGALVASITDVWGRTATAQVDLSYESTPAAPTVSLSVAAAGNGRLVEISGSVAGENVAGLTVVLGGVVSGSATTDASGAFVVTLEASAIGAVTAETTDSYGQTGSSSAEFSVDDPAVVLSTSSIAADGSVQVAGYVVGQWDGTPTVVFSGVASGQLPSDWGGNYYYGTLTVSGPGALVVSITDLWGRTVSAESYVDYAPDQHDAPTISLAANPNGTGRQIDIYGTVQSESPYGLTVWLGGVVSGSATTDGGGAFAVTLEASALGTITASVTDAWGQTAETSIEITAAQPAITLTASSLAADGSIQVAGYVEGHWEGTPIVVFSGIAGGELTSNWAGNYFFGTLWPAGAGTLVASITDVWGRTVSAQADVAPYQPQSPSAPAIYVSATLNGNGRQVDVSGYVEADSPAGMTVWLGGVVNGSVTTDSSGAFFITLEASALGTITAATTDSWSQTGEAAVELTAADPVLNLAVGIVTAANTVSITGTLDAGSPVNTTISFSGAVSGYASAGSDGSFALEAGVAYYGTVTVTATDQWGRTATATASVEDPSPSLELAVENLNDGRMVRVYGTVHSPYAADVMVNLEGVVSTSIVTDGEGRFSVTLEASALGAVSGSFTDFRGQTATASATITDAAPQVTSFLVVQNETTCWEVTGTVSDNAPAGSTLVFGGALEGITGTLGSDGTFSFVTNIQMYTGYVCTVQVVDPWGNQSNLAEYEIG